MRRWALSLLVLAFFIPAQVQVNALPSLAALEVDLWPEYDRPSTLVIYKMTLDANTTLPVNMSILIPTAAGDPNAVATRETNGLSNLAYTRTILGDRSAISFTTTSLQIQFEYYDPGLNMNGSTRTFTYLWQGDYSVKTLTLQVQQPVSATQMQISPALGNPISGGDGLVYYNAAVGSVPAGTKFTLSFKYEKNNNTLSQSAQPVTPSENLNAKTTGRTPNPLSDLAYGLLAFGVLLLAGGGYWYFRTGQAKKIPEMQKRHNPRQAVEEISDATPQDAIFCPQCGKRASPGDLFCRLCGTRLNTE